MPASPDRAARGGSITGTSEPGLAAPLRHRDFRYLVTAYSVSSAGSWAYKVGLTVYVYDQTRSAAWVGAVTIGRFLPSILLAGYAGVLADRFERKSLMVVLNALCCASMAALAIWTRDGGSPLGCIAIAALTSLLTVTYDSAVNAFAPQLVPEDDLAAANALQSSVSNLATIVGPALGAVLLIVGSPVWSFAANAVSFALAAALVSAIRAQSGAADLSAEGSLGHLRQVLVGAQTIFASPTTSALVAYAVVANLVYGIDTVLLVELSKTTLGTGASGYSYLLAGLGLGGVLGALLVKGISSSSRLSAPLLGATALYCVPTLAFLVIRQPAVGFATEIVRGIGALVLDVVSLTALQRSLPRDKLARVFGAYSSFVLLAVSLGALVTPRLLATVGLTWTLWFAGALIPFGGLLGWPWLRRADRSNAAELEALRPRIALLDGAAIFTRSSRSLLERLARAATTVEARPGLAIVREGEAADAFYLVETGVVTISSRIGTGTIELATLGPGDYFGEIGLLRRVPRTATVTASAPARLLRIEGDDFLGALSSGIASPSLLEGAATRMARTQALAPVAIAEVGGA